MHQLTDEKGYIIGCGSSPQKVAFNIDKYKPYLLSSELAFGMDIYTFLSYCREYTGNAKYSITFLTRTNFSLVVNAVAALFDGAKQGMKISFLGGDSEVRKEFPIIRDLCNGLLGTSSQELNEDGKGMDIDIYDPRHRQIIELGDRIGYRVIIQYLDVIDKMIQVRNDDYDILFSTVHRAKGLEWDAVMISNDMSIVSNEEFRQLFVMPIQQKSEQFQSFVITEAEEINILYVAVTRAKKFLCLSQKFGELCQGCSANDVISISSSDSNYNCSKCGKSNTDNILLRSFGDCNDDIGKMICSKCI